MAMRFSELVWTAPASVSATPTLHQVKLTAITSSFVSTNATVFGKKNRITLGLASISPGN